MERNQEMAYFSEKLQPFLKANFSNLDSRNIDKEKLVDIWLGVVQGYWV